MLIELIDCRDLLPAETDLWQDQYGAAVYALASGGSQVVVSSVCGNQSFQRHESAAGDCKREQQDIFCGR